MAVTIERECGRRMAEYLLQDLHIRTGGYGE
jgi:hypothetical protein